MRMVVVSNGITYKGKSNDKTAKEMEKDIADIYELAGELNKLQLELEDGRFLVLPKRAAQNCHLLFEE
jgi:hypothetical protein